MKESIKRKEIKDQIGNGKGTGEQMEESNMHYYNDFYTDIPTLEEFGKIVEAAIKETNEKFNYPRQ